MSYPTSLADLAIQTNHAAPARLRGAFAIDVTTAASMHMGDKAWLATSAALRAPRGAVERQQLVISRDLATGAEAVVNSLRGRRTMSTEATAPRPPTPSGSPADACGWCDREAWHVSRDDLPVDEFGAVYAADGRVRAGPNWARQAPVSGVVFGDEAMHDLQSLSTADVRAIFEAAEGYVKKAATALPDVRYFEVFVNGGSRSGASVRHAHAQVAGRRERHFAYPHAIATRAPADYWNTSRIVHEDLGLATDFEHGIAWASLVPLKERDVTAFSANLPDGAEMMHSILRAFIEHGTSSFSLAAILAPGYATGEVPDGPFSNWPPVLWRFVDRGSVEQRHADIGCLELFGTSVVATDPFMVARWISEAATFAAKR